MFEGQTDFETTLGKRKIDHMPILCNECPSCRKVSAKTMRKFKHMVRHLGAKFICKPWSPRIWRRQPSIHVCNNNHWECWVCLRRLQIQLISTNLIPPHDCWTGTSVFSVFSMSTCGRQSLQSLPPRNQSFKQPEHIHWQRILDRIWSDSHSTNDGGEDDLF